MAVADWTPAIFIDKDGTLVDDIPFNVDPQRIRLAEGAGHALRRLQGMGYRLIVVTNQSGVARGLFAEHAMDAVRDRLAELLAAHEVALDGFEYCPHWPHGRVARHAFACNCRKPLPGMLLHAADKMRLDLKASWMIGDILDDIEAGRRAGCRTILIDDGNETQWRIDHLRHPHRLARDLTHAADIIEDQAAR